MTRIWDSLCMRRSANMGAFWPIKKSPLLLRSPPLLTSKRTKGYTQLIPSNPLGNSWDQILSRSSCIWQEREPCSKIHFLTYSSTHTWLGGACHHSKPPSTQKQPWSFKVVAIFGIISRGSKCKPSKGNNHKHDMIPTKHSSMGCQRFQNWVWKGLPFNPISSPPLPTLATTFEHQKGRSNGHPSLWGVKYGLPLQLLVFARNPLRWLTNWEIVGNNPQATTITRHY